MKFEDAVQPERDLMLVLREPGNESEWKGLAIPESARKADQIMGTIRKSGPLAPYPPGTTIVTGRGAGTVIGLIENSQEELALVQPMDVLAVVGGAYDSP